MTLAGQGLSAFNKTKQEETVLPLLFKILLTHKKGIRLTETVSTLKHPATGKDRMIAAFPSCRGGWTKPEWVMAPGSQTIRPGRGEPLSLESRSVWLQLLASGTPTATADTGPTLSSSPPFLPRKGRFLGKPLGGGL